MTAFPTPEPDQGATNKVDPDPDVLPPGNDGSGALSPETVAALVALARVLDPDACDPPATSLPIGEAAEVWRRQDAALLTARRVWEAGWRLVSEDDATVDRIVRALHDEWCGCEEGLADHRDGYRHNLDDAARAAVRALREAGE